MNNPVLVGSMTGIFAHRLVTTGAIFVFNNGTRNKAMGSKIDVKGAGLVCGSVAMTKRKRE